MLDEYNLRKTKKSRNLLNICGDENSFHYFGPPTIRCARLHRHSGGTRSGQRECQACLRVAKWCRSPCFAQSHLHKARRLQWNVFAAKTWCRHERPLCLKTTRQAGKTIEKARKYRQALGWPLDLWRRLLNVHKIATAFRWLRLSASDRTWRVAAKRHAMSANTSHANLIPFLNIHMN